MDARPQPAREQSRPPGPPPAPGAPVAAAEPPAPAPEPAPRRDAHLVRDTFARLGHSPVRPGSLFDLMAANAHEPQDVSHCIRRCPVLTGRVLAAVNCAATGVRQRVDSVERAVVMLGPSRARLVALSYGLRLLHQQSRLPPGVIDILWTNSLQKACAAQRLGALIDPALADQAFTLALIQDIGLPALVGVDRLFYETVLAAGPGETWSELERRHFGFDHGAAGQYLLLECGADDLLQQAVLHHHRPPTLLASTERESILSVATYLAGLLPHWNEEATPNQHEWMQAIHARFLAEQFPAPGQFLLAVAADAFRLVGQDRAATPTERPAYHRQVRRLVGEVAASADRMVIKLCRLEHAMQSDRQDIKDLQMRAFTDPLTRVLNRAGFVELSRRRLDAALQRGESVCCMLSDMDNFKRINDDFGHEAGDRVLRGLAKLFRRTLSPGALVGRLGGDEFAAFLTGVSPGDAAACARQVIDAVQRCRLRVLPGVEIAVSVSLGAVHTAGGCGPMDLDALLKAADAAMYRRKRAGKHDLTFINLDEEPLEGDGSNPEARVRAEPR